MVPGQTQQLHIPITHTHTHTLTHSYTYTHDHNIIIPYLYEWFYHADCKYQYSVSGAGQKKCHKKENISFSPPFSSKIVDLSENVRLEGPKRQAMVSCSRQEKQARSLLWRAKKTGNESRVAGLITKHGSWMNSCSCCYSHLLQETYCLFLWPATGD